MNRPADILLILVLMANLFAVGSSRLRTCIRAVAFQGAVLACVPLALLSGPGLAERVRAAGLAVLCVTLRGVVFPWLLTRAQREANVRREVEPFVGFGASIGVALLTLVVSLRLAQRLPSAPGGGSFAVAVALSTLLVGVFIIVSRRLALNQVLGYLVMDNGIYLLGVAMVEHVPLVVELGVLTDAFVAVFVMSIATWHISREFDHTEVDRLSRLKG